MIPIYRLNKNLVIKIATYAHQHLPKYSHWTIISPFLVQLLAEANLCRDACKKH